MRRARVLLVLPLAAFLTGATCRGGSGVNYQPAKKPILVKIGGWHWPADTNGVGYTGGLGFQLTVKHTLFNELSVKVVQGGVATDVLRVDAWPPTGPARPVYRKLQTLATDANLMTETVLLHVYPAEAFSSPLTPPPDGTRRTYQVFETSADPAITGPARTSDPAEATLVVWSQSCVVPVFDVTPANAVSGTSVTATWRADECKNVKVLEWVVQTPPPPATPGSVPHVIEEKTFVDQPAGVLSGTTTLVVGPLTTALGIRATSANGKTWMTWTDLQINPAGPCPGNQPYGQKKWFDFCETCLGRPPNPTSLPACTKEEAREKEDKFLLGTNCTAADGACFTDGGGGGSSGSPTQPGTPTPEGCCCRPGATQPICSCCEPEWSCKNAARTTWTEGTSCQ
jgi:hypothetical protein